MPTENPMSFGAALRAYRLAAGLTQEQLAERAGLGVRTIAYLEQARSRSGTPRRETLQLLARALGLSPQEQAVLLSAARGQGGDNGGTRHPGAAPSGASLHPLVGRRETLARLDAHLRGDGPPLFLLAGEPGIGKTRLLREVAHRAVAAGWTVLTGGCHRLGGQEPYAPLLEALQRHLAGQDPLTLRRTLEGCAWLVQLLPELADGPIPPLPNQALPNDQQRRLMVAAVQRYLANISGLAGTLLLLDDLQWAGWDALALVATLLRAASQLPLRVVGAYRDTEVRGDHPLATLLADVAPAGLARLEPLGPLALEEATQLLAALLPKERDGERLGGDRERGGDRDLPARILQRAGGVPFFLVSCAQALCGVGAGGAQAPDGDVVPWDLRQSLQQRVGDLSQHAQGVLGVGAVIGREAPAALLLEVADLPEDAAAEALDEACRAGLLVELGRDSYQFVHDVIREVVEADLGAARRAVLHRRIAEALERRSGSASAELLAYHFTLAGGDAQDQALRYLELAGDHARAQHAYDLAERHYRGLVERLQAPGREREVMTVREKLGEVLEWSGRYVDALSPLEQAAEGYRAASDFAGEARVTAHLARVYGESMRPEQGIARITALLARIERQGERSVGDGSDGASDGGDGVDGVRDDVRAQAPLHSELGRLLVMIGRYTESLHITERAGALAHEAGDELAALLAVANQAQILNKLSRMDEAVQTLHAVIQRAEAQGEWRLVGRMERNLAHCLAFQGDFATAWQRIERALVFAQQWNDHSGRLAATSIRGWLAFLRGDWRAARVDLEHAITLSDQSDPWWFTTYPLLFLAQLCLAEGDLPAASAAGAGALAQAEECDDLQGIRWLSAVLAELDIQEGRADSALGRLLPLLDRWGLEEGDVTDILPVLAWASLEAGQHERAWELARQALARARAENAKFVLTEALRVHALVALRKEQWVAAAGSLEEGVTLARAMPYPYAEARLLRLEGERLAALRDAAGAQKRWDEAHAIFLRLGAARAAEQTAGALATPSQKPPLGATRLTDAQWAQIAALLPTRHQGRGRPRADDRRTIEAILYVQHTGCAWADVPPELGNDATAHRRWREWQAAGLWDQIAALAPRPGVEAEIAEERQIEDATRPPVAGGASGHRARRDDC